MSDFSPTPSQKEAIETHGGTVLVSAGAGSGKTKVLTERLMKAVLDRDTPKDINRFVVITFTNASAAELMSRITEELSRAEAALAEEEAVSPAFLTHVRRQQALCQKAQIGTIHHFCANLLREYGHLIGLPSDFRIVSDDLALSMKEETLSRLLDEKYKKIQNDPEFESLVNSVGIGRNDDRLAELVLSLYEKMQCHARPDQWASGCVSALQEEYTDIGESPWGREILKAARAETAYWVEELDRVTEAISADETVSRAYLEGIAQGADGVRELARCLRIGWDAARQCPPVAFGKLLPVKKEHAPALTEMVKKRRDACKKALEKISSQLYADSETISKELKRTTPAMNALLQLTLSFEKAYAKEKRKEGLADYADLEHFAAKLLTEEDGTSTPLAKIIGERYEEIMIDEYQDVSRVQETIFQAVSNRGEKLFLVGDVKQAIYRFRLADPDIFNQKFKDFPLKSLAQPGKPGKIILRENFRSRREILDAANSIFSCCMTETLGDVAYDENSSLVYGAKGYAGSVPPPEVWLYSLPEADQSGKIPDKTAFEAACTAEKILQLIRSKVTVTDSEGERNLRFGDIAVLLRNANSVGGVYRRVFTEKGIPVVSGQGGDFFETREISFVLSMLSIMDNPKNEVALLAVLTSPVFGFSGDDLAAIRASDREAGFYEALKCFAEENEKARCFLDTLEAFREEAPDLTAEKMVRKILYQTDILAVCSAMPDGERRYANLVQMLSLASGFEKDGYHGLHQFVRYLEKRKKKNSVVAERKREDSAVQIMSIHHAKGLEFPVVFLCDTARRFNRKDTMDTVLVHPELGLGPKIVDNDLLVQYPSFARKAIALRVQRETLSEEMRLLYVAVTRAKERLFLSAVVDDAEAFLEKQKMTVPLTGERAEPEALAKAMAPMEWIVTAALADQGKTLTLHCGGEQTHIEETVLEKQAEAADEKILREMEEKLCYAYPFSSSQMLPSKVTATELKYLKTAEDPEAAALVQSEERHHYFRKPDFAAEKKPATGAERGIATHLALQYMDLSKAGSPDGIREEIKRLEENKYLSAREAAAVDQSSVLKLFRSELGERIRNADKLHREFRFSLLCQSGELFETESEEQILLQGVVDCCIEEAGELVIIDYKTDAVHTPEQIRQRCELYTSQIKAYSMALTRILGKPVKETILYFLSCNQDAIV